MNDFTLVREKLSGRHAVPVEEAAKLLGLGRRTVYDAIERGEIPNAGLAGAKRVPVWFLVQRLDPPLNPSSTVKNATNR